MIVVPLWANGSLAGRARSADGRGSSRGMQASAGRHGRAAGSAHPARGRVRSGFRRARCGSSVAPARNGGSASQIEVPAAGGHVLSSARVSSLFPVGPSRGRTGRMSLFRRSLPRPKLGQTISVRDDRDRADLVRHLHDGLADLARREASGVTTHELQILIQVCGALRYRSWRSGRDKRWRNSPFSTSRWPDDLPERT